MNKYKVESIASAGEQITNYVGIPEIYLDFINQGWQSKNGSVISVLLDDRDDCKWIDLGNILVTDLMSFGYIGLSVDGSIPDFIGTWLKLITSEAAYGVLEMRQSFYHHPTKKVLLANTSFHSLQSTQNLMWPKSLWKNTQSELFNYGCDLIITAYKEDIIRITGEMPLTFKQFGESLKNAVGWMIPLDGNIGFILGIQSDSTFGKSYTVSLK